MYHFELKPFGQWNPASEWEKEVDRLFGKRSETYVPAVEVTDEEKAFFISMDIPGLRKEDLEIEVKDNQLIISGERKFTQTSEKNNILRSEKRYGKFSRVFTLPKNVNADAIEARFENGVLEIALPKEEKAQSKKIVISDWKKDVPSDVKN